MVNSTISIEQTFANLNMSLIKLAGNQSVWTGQMDTNVNSNLTIPPEPYNVPTEGLTPLNQKYIQMVAFVDKVFPTWLTSAVSGG